MIRNITLSAEEALIRKARDRAAQQHKSLNELFREWILKYVGGGRSPENYRKLMKNFSHIKAGKKFSREEMNER